MNEQKTMNLITEDEFCKALRLISLNENGLAQLKRVNELINSKMEHEFIAMDSDGKSFISEEEKDATHHHWCFSRAIDPNDHEGT